MEMVEKTTLMVMAEKVIPIEEMDVVDEEMVAEEGGMLISRKSRLPHSKPIIFGITRQFHQQPPTMTQ